MNRLFITISLLENYGRIIAEILHIIQENLKIQSDSLFQRV